MTAIDDLSASISALEGSVATESATLTQVVSALNDTKQQLSDLQATVAAGGSVTPADLEALAGRVTSVADAAAAAAQAGQGALGSAPAGGTSGGTPAPDPTAGGTAGAPAPTGDPTAGGTDTPTGTPTSTDQLDRTVYTFGGDPSTIDASLWPPSGYETAAADPRPLFFFSGDAAAGDNNGDGQDNGQWVRYVGGIQQAAETSTAG